MSLISKTKLDDDLKTIETLDLYYWAVYPSGRYEKQNLLQIHDGDITVMGRPIQNPDPADLQNVIEAARRIHTDMRKAENHVPNVAQIMDDCHVGDSIGEKLKYPGFDAQKGIYFSAVRPAFSGIKNANDNKNELILPVDALKPLAGMTTNTLDADHSYFRHDFLQASAVLTDIKKRFEAKSYHRKSTRDKDVLIRNRPVDILSDKKQDWRKLAQVRWKEFQGEGVKLACVKDVKVMGASLKSKGVPGLLAGLGVVNKTHNNMLGDNDYPYVKDHLTEYGLLHMAQSSANPPTTQGRMVLTSEGGNNTKEIVVGTGIGEDIGGNCKTVVTEWLDPKTSEVKRVGAILDFGMYLMKDKSQWTGAVADIVEKLDYCKHVFITHHHLDHLDGIVPYVKKGFIGPGHTVHVTDRVLEMAKDKLVKAGIPKEEWPQFEVLSGTGVVDLTCDKGVKRLSIMYGEDAVPHTARCSPFIAYGRMGDRILGSYQYLGDMRYDDEWFKNHKSEFWDAKKFMLAREPNLDPKHLKPTYSEIDLTSVKREGRAPAEKQVEDNLVHIMENWFYDLNAALIKIGTAESRQETILRAATKTQRNITAEGRAVQFLFQISNKLGVNKWRYPKEMSGKSTGIQDYLNEYAQELELDPVTFRFGGKERNGWISEGKPGSVIVVGTGSQGTDIEKDAFAPKAAELRSKWDADPYTDKKATPTDFQNWFFAFTQSAIPGNKGQQRKLIKKLAKRGCPVLEAFGDNVRIHNPGSFAKRILKDLQDNKDLLGATGVEIEPDGSIMIENFPIHASGHGRKGDFKLWVTKLKSKMFGGHHTDDPETAIDAYRTIEDMGKNIPEACSKMGSKLKLA